MSAKKDLGQYFTIAEPLKQFVFDKVKHKNSLLLEPSFGAGHLLQKFKDFDNNYPMICYELDHTIQPVVTFNKHQTAVYGDFTIQPITKKFKTIIGNPPYVRQNKGNLFITFLELCFDLLDYDGELLFILPSHCFKLHYAAPIITKMIEHGNFTHFLFPHNQTLFKGAHIDVVAFRYEKAVNVTNKTVVNGKDTFYDVKKGILTFSDTQAEGVRIGDKFDAYRGITSGRDAIFQQPFGNLDVLVGDGVHKTFICATCFPTGNVQIDAHLLAHKPELLARKMREFTEDTWFRWSADSHNTINVLGLPCIYIRRLTRQKQVAFIGKVENFKQTLTCLVPKEPMSGAQMQKFVEAFNSPEFQNNYIYAKRFRVDPRHILNATIVCQKN